MKIQLKSSCIPRNSVWVSIHFESSNVSIRDGMIHIDFFIKFRYMHLSGVRKRRGMNYLPNHHYESLQIHVSLDQHSFVSYTHCIVSLVISNNISLWHHETKHQDLYVSNMRKRYALNKNSNMKYKKKIFIISEFY